MERNEILANLYSLKAGLSVISTAKDKVSVKKEEYDRCENLAQRNLQDQSNMKRKIAEEKSRLNSEEERLENLNKNFHIDIPVGANDPYEEKINKLKKNHISDVCLALFLLIGGIAFLANFFSSNRFASGLDLLLIPVSAIAAVIGTIVLIASLASYSSLMKQYQDERRSRDDSITSQTLAKHKSETDYIKYHIDEYQKEYNRKYSTLCQMERNQPKLNEASKLAKKEFEEVAKVMVPVAESVLNALVKKYSGVFVEENWEMLDYVIYAIQTGRADTIKEALHFADEERRFGNLINAIGVASDYIAKTVEIAIQRLGNRISYCINDLREEISSQSKKVIESNRMIASEIGSMRAATVMQIEQATGAINDSISSLKAESQKQSEMIEGIKKSSVSTAKDMRFFMQSEYQYFR